MPECPYDLGDAGERWWTWAWSTPQALKWDGGALYTVARRAALEDQLARLEFEEGPELADFLRGADDETIRQIEWAMSMLRRAATGAVSLSKEMRELEAQLGFGAKSMAGLGWKADEKPKVSKVDELRARRAARQGSAAS